MDKVLALDPQSVDALTVAAGILDATGRKAEARTYYERALAVEPESRHLRMSYAANLASTGSLKEAIGVYEKLIADFPEEQAFYQYAGIAHSYLGEYDRAISLLRQALAIRPTPVGLLQPGRGLREERRPQGSGRGVPHVPREMPKARSESERRARPGPSSRTWKRRSASPPS